MRRIKKGDQVVVLAGKDKGKQGKIIQMLLAKNYARVEGVNLIKKHIKPNPQKNIAGGIVKKEAPIHLSNLAVYNPLMKKGGKIKIRVEADGKRFRIFKSNNEMVDI